MDPCLKTDPQTRTAKRRHRPVSLFARALIAAFTLIAASSAEPPQASATEATCVTRALFGLGHATGGAAAWVEFPTQALGKYGEFFAISDIHGELKKFQKLLRSAGLIDGEGTWTGGRNVLTVAGDMINKGRDSYQTVLFVRRLQQEAEAAGGKVLALLGNHEVELLVDPRGASPELLKSIRRAGANPTQVLAPESELLRYLGQLPVGAFIGDAAVAHGGYVTSKSVRRSARAWQREDFEKLLQDSSPVNARSWELSRKRLRKGRETADDLGIRTIVFGHAPQALGKKGIARSEDGLLVKLDIAIGSREAELLHCRSLLRFSELGAGACTRLGSDGRSRPLSIGHKLAD